MNTNKDFVQRKTIRLKGFDYSSEGAYFVTICTQDRKQILSEIITITPVDTTNFCVGEGLAPPVYSVKLKPCGEVVYEQIKLLESRFQNVHITDFVIMPDHIHMIIFLNRKAGGASPSPTLNDVVCAFKSLTSRICKQKYGVQKMFQRSFAEHVIRDREDYDKHRRYIYENPLRWYYDELRKEE